VYVKLSSRQTSEVAQVNSVQPPPLEQPSVTPVSGDKVAAKPVRRARSGDKSARAKPSEDVDDAVRSGVVVPNLTLKEVKKIYIEIRGGELPRNLIERLNSSGVVVVTSNADDADAALKIVVSQNSTSVLLVNARGTVLWPKHFYSGEPSKVASEIVKDLLSEFK